MDGNWAQLTPLRPRLMRLATRLCMGNQEEADDLCQETLVRTIRYVDRATPQALWNIAATVLRHVSTDRFRLSARVQCSDQLEDKVSFSIEDELQRRDLLRRIEGLPLEQRELLTFVYAEGHSLEEASAHFKCTPEAIKQRLKRLRQKLQTALQEVPA